MKLSTYFSGLVVSALAIMGLSYAMAAQGQSLEAPLIKQQGPYPSSTPQYLFAETLQAQERQLANNPLLKRFAKARAALASDRYRPAYHFVSPEGALNDPNGLSYWQGRWHLFYQAYPPDEFPAWKDMAKRRQHWGHAVSDDLIHWRDLPYAIYPGSEKMVFSGSTLVEKDRVIAFYPGIEAGQMVAISRDPLLLNWEKNGPVNTTLGDSDIWKEGDTYFGVMGGLEKYYPEATTPPDRFRGDLMQRMYGNGVWPKWSLWKSHDLKDWKPAGSLLLENTPFSDRYDDGACPNFQKIGDKYIMLFFSHTNGGRYLLGDYDQVAHKFRPYDSGQFNHGQVAPGGVHAPSAASDDQGGVINIFNINDAKQTENWDQIMSLPQRLTLDTDKRLLIEPVAAIATLRGDQNRVGEMKLPANREIMLDGIHGDTIELEVEIDPQEASQVQLNVLRSPDGAEQTSISFYNYDRKQKYWWYDSQQEIVLDQSRSSTLQDVSLRPPERAILRKEKGGSLKLRIFIDRSVVEVFANGKQYLATRVYPARRDSQGVSIEARGGSAVLKSLNAWKMKTIW